MRASGAGAHGTPFNSYLIGLQRIPNSKVFGVCLVVKLIIFDDDFARKTLINCYK